MTVWNLLAHLPPICIMLYVKQNFIQYMHHFMNMNNHVTAMYLFKYNVLFSLSRMIYKTILLHFQWRILNGMKHCYCG